MATCVVDNDRYRDVAIKDLIIQRSEARKRGAYDLADEFKNRLLHDFGIEKLSDNADFSTTYVSNTDCATLLSAPPVCVTKKSTVSGRRRKALRKNERKMDTKGRGLAFATFLLETFGEKLLHEGPVVDVAGGRGDTSWELALRWNVRCCIIDPLGLRLSKNRQKIILCRSCNSATNGGVGPLNTDGGARHSQRKLVVSDFDPIDTESVADCTKEIIKHVETNFDEKIVVGADAGAEEEVNAEATAETNGGPMVDMVELERCMGITQQRRLFVSDDACEDLVKSSCLLAGLHADEATEIIVDVALETGKPFAIVPCCVFPRLFPNRFLPNGNQVRSLESFLEYLQNKDAAIKRAVVPNLLPPTNIALYKFAE